MDKRYSVRKTIKFEDDKKKKKKFPSIKFTTENHVSIDLKSFILCHENITRTYCY